MLKKGADSTIETRKSASITLVLLLKPLISCGQSILSKVTTPPPLQLFSQQVSQVTENLFASMYH